MHNLGLIYITDMKKIENHYLFYSNKIKENRLLLDDEEVRHAYTVLRLENGAIIHVTDGVGNIYTGQIDYIDKKKCDVLILNTQIQKQQKPFLHFMVGMPEKDAFENMLLGIVPLGVVRIVPLVTQYCQKAWWAAKWDKHKERFNRKMATAAKQSWNAWIPLLDAPIPFSQALDHIKETSLVAHITGTSLSEFLKETNIPETLRCLVGPPGGFSPSELSSLETAGSVFITLGTHRLRTELAATVFAGTIVQYCMDSMAF